MSVVIARVFVKSLTFLVIKSSQLWPKKCLQFIAYDVYDVYDDIYVILLWRPPGVGRGGLWGGDMMRVLCALLHVMRL